MGTLSQLVQGVQRNVNSTISDISGKTANAFQNAVGSTQAFVAGLYSGDVVGINENQIPSMKAAITAYVDELSAHLDNVRTNADTTQAFKGDYALAITDYVTAVCETCKALISYLLEFNKKLEDVYTAYKAKDTDLASGIRSQGSELQGSATRYTN